MNRPGVIALATTGIILIRAGIRTGDVPADTSPLAREAVMLALIAGAFWIAADPDRARTLRLALQLATVRALRESAAQCWTLAIRLESSYRASVAP